MKESLLRALMVPIYPQNTYSIDRKYKLLHPTPLISKTLTGLIASREGTGDQSSGTLRSAEIVTKVPTMNMVFVIYFF